MIEFNGTNALYWSRLSSRKTYGAILEEIAPEYPNLMVLVADVAASAGLTGFSQKFPSQFLNVGIAEQNRSSYYVRGHVSTVVPWSYGQDKAEDKRRFETGRYCDGASGCQSSAEQFKPCFAGNYPEQAPHYCAK